MVAARALILVFSIIVAACGGGKPAASPGQPIPVKVNWTAVTGANSGLWTAYEAGYFKDENLAVDLIHIPSSKRTVEALITGDVQFGNVDTRNLVEAVVSGADVRAVQGITNRLVFSVMASSKIQSPQDLKGKKLGITGVGSSTHTAALQALRIWGLEPGKDVNLVSLTEVPNILAAMQTGQIDAGILSPPTNTRAKQASFKELINLATDGPAYPSVTVGAKASYISANPEVVRKFVRAYAKGVHRFKTDKAYGINAIKGYLKVDDQSVLEDTWQQFNSQLAVPPYVLGFDLVIADVAATNDKAKGAKPEQFLDMTFVKELDNSGFFKRLYASS